MDNKITIIEGPTPTFETIHEDDRFGGGQSWAHGVLEGPFLTDVAFTTLRTFNSARLMERCENAWQEKETMYLVYRDTIGLTKETPIIAVRAGQMEEGEVLFLWVRQEPDLGTPGDSLEGPDLD